MKLQKCALLVYACVLGVGLSGVARAPGDEIAWGESNSGLRAGIALEGADTVCEEGKPVDFVIFVNNVGQDSIPLEYIEPILKTWVPDVHDPTGRALPVMPYTWRQRGGRIMSPDLGPGKELEIGRATLIVRPLGWEGKIDKTVAFAAAGQHTISYTLKLGPHHHRPSGKYPWAGELTTGRLALQVKSVGSTATTKASTAFSKQDMQTVLFLLGDYERHQLFGVSMDGGMDDWQKRREAWGDRCAALKEGAVKYLGHIALEHADDGYRAIACDALDDTGQKEVIPTLVKCLADSSPDVRRTAVRSLGNLRRRSEKVIPNMLPLLQDKDENVRAGAAYALGHIGSRRATQGLVQAFTNEKVDRVKQAISLAIGWIADPAAFPVLKKELAGPTEMSKTGLQNVIRNIEDPDYWGLGVKGGISESQLYRILLKKVDLSAAMISTEEAESEIRKSQSKQWNAAFQSVGGIVYYLSDKNVFYVRQDSRDHKSKSYYGPFEGNPHDIVRSERKELERKQDEEQPKRED